MATITELQQQLAAQQARNPGLVERLNGSLAKTQLIQQQIKQQEDIIAGLDGPLRQAPPALTSLAGGGSVGVQRARAVARSRILATQLADEAVVQGNIETELQQVANNSRQLEIKIAELRTSGSTPVVIPVQSTQSPASQDTAARQQAQAQAQIAVQRGQAQQGDWRVKLRLAGSADYLYRANDPGILAPLASTDGIVFPYMPNITTNYVANYNNYDLTHSNYRGYFYQNSQVSEVQIDATFTAQDTVEANYLLAVIHFFRSVTKMFYGQSSNQYRGAPPPLVFLQGLGEFQFNLAPCAVQNFNYVLPSDVDYIRADVANVTDTNLQSRRNSFETALGDGTFQESVALARLKNAQIPLGGLQPKPSPASLRTQLPTYVPTKMQINLTLLPVQTRAQVSKEFSFEQFANGNLIRRGFW